MLSVKLPSTTLQDPHFAFGLQLSNNLLLPSSLCEECSSSLGSKVASLHPEPLPNPESLPLHDVPQLAQVGLGDDVVRFELECAQVVGLRLRKLSIQVEDGAEVHQSRRVLREDKYRVREGSNCGKGGRVLHNAITAVSCEILGCRLTGLLDSRQLCRPWFYLSGQTILNLPFSGLHLTHAVM